MCGVWTTSRRETEKYAYRVKIKRASGKPQICFFCFSKQNKREKAEKAGKLRDNQAGSTAIKREKHEKQRAVFLMRKKAGQMKVYSSSETVVYFPKSVNKSTNRG